MLALLSLLALCALPAVADATDPYSIDFANNIFTLNRTDADWTVAGRPLAGRRAN